MKRWISLFLCLLLLCSASLTYADGFKTITYEMNFEVDDAAFPESMHSAKDWKTFLEKFSVKGIAHFKDLFRDDEMIEGAADIYLNNKLLLDLLHSGTQQYFSITSKSMDAYFGFNAHNYYEFMLKGYFFLGLPTHYIALLSYPNGAYQALNNIYKFLAKHFRIDEKMETNEISYEKLTQIAEEASRFFDEEYISHQFIRTALMDAGVFETMYYDFQVATEYLESFAAGEPMRIEKDGSKYTYRIGEYEIIQYDVQENRREYKLYLPPSPSGYEYRAEAIVEKVNDNYNVDGKFAILMDGADYAAIAVSAKQLPGEQSEEAEGETIFSLSGDALGGTESVVFQHSYAKHNENLNLKLRMRDETTKQFPLGIKINAALSDFSGSVEPKYKDAYVGDFFSMNDSALSALKGTLLPYAIKVALPILLETPAKVINDVYNFLDKSGILTTLTAK